VVIHDVPPNSTVVGNPGHPVRVEGKRPEGPDADWAHLPDPIADALKGMSARVGALEKALAEAGFVLEVTRVVEVEEEVEIRQWTVETKHGRRSFQTHLDDWPRVLPLGGLLIRDVAGDLYRLPPPETLAGRGRELLWAFGD